MTVQPRAPGFAGVLTQEVVEEGLLELAAVAAVAVFLVLVAAELLEDALGGLAIEAGLAPTAGLRSAAAPRDLAQERLVVLIPAVEGLRLALEDLVELTAIQPDAAARAARVDAHARALHLDQLRPVARAHRSHAEQRNRTYNAAPWRSCVQRFSPRSSSSQAWPRPPDPRPPPSPPALRAGGA